MKIILLGCLLCLLAYSSSASIFSSLKTDTLEKGIDSLPDKQSFLEKYGRDDSSRALINFFFYKKNISRRMNMTGSILAAVFLTGVPITQNNANTNSDSLDEDLGKFFLAGMVILASGGAFAILTTGIVLSIRYSRKRLTKLLDHYFGGHGIQRGIRKNKIFRGFLQYGEWNGEIKREIKTAEKIKALERRRQILEKRRFMRAVN